MFAIIETDCAGGLGKRHCRSPWGGHQGVLQHYKRCTKNRTVVMGYATFKSFPINRFNSSQQYIVLTIRPEKRSTVYNNVRFVCMSEFNKMDTTDFILVGGYTMFRLLHDRIHHMFRYCVNNTCNECDIFEY
jgi:dihydrofolate reductase